MSPLRVLRESAFFYRHHLTTIARLCLPLLLLERGCTMAFAEQFSHWPPFAPQLLLSVLFYPLYSAMLILFLDARSRGEPTPSAASLFGMALQRWPAFALLSAISTVLISLGLSLLMIPGLILVVLLAFSEFLLVLRGYHPLRAIRGSLRRVRGQFWPLAACIYCTLLPLWLLDAWLAEQLAGQPVANVVGGAFSGLLQLFVNVVVYRYFTLLEQRGHLTVEED